MCMCIYIFTYVHISTYICIMNTWVSKVPSTMALRFVIWGSGTLFWFFWRPQLAWRSECESGFSSGLWGSESLSGPWKLYLTSWHFGTFSHRLCDVILRAFGVRWNKRSEGGQVSGLLSAQARQQLETSVGSCSYEVRRAFVIS